MSTDSIINIVINTVKRGGGDKDQISSLKKVNQTVKEFTGLNIGALTAVGLLSGGVKALSNFVRTSIDDFTGYVSTIQDMARNYGYSYEEASRLYQVMDDLFIKEEDVGKALKTGLKNGLDISTEGLKTFADQYLSLEPGVARSNLLLEKFGKTGLSLGKFFEQGSNGIDEMLGSVDESLIVTKRSALAVEYYKQSLDNLGDTVDSVKYKFASGLIPTTDLLIRTFSKGEDSVEKYYRAHNRLNREIEHWSGLAATGNKEAQEEIAKLRLELDQLDESAMKTGGALAGDAGLVGDVSEVTRYFKDLTREVIFNHLAAKMDGDAQLELARQMGLVDLETYNTLTALDELNTKYDTNGDGVISLKEKTAEYNAELAQIKGYQDSLVDKTVEYTIIVHEVRDSTTSTTGLGGDSAHNPYVGLPHENRAVGGPVYAGRGYWVGEEGPEPFFPAVDGVIIPHDRAFGAGQISIVVNGAGDPKSVAQEVMRELSRQGVGRL